MSYLPPEFFNEILWALPVKSLCRFKSVSKKWPYLISDPHFVKTHLSRAQTLGRTRLLADGEIVEVYSLGKNSRTSVKSGFLFPNKYYKMGFLVKVGVYLNGTIHWAFEDLDGSCVIAAFDLVEEKFKTLPPPDNVLEGDCRYTLGVCGRYLYLAADKSDCLKEFCVMLEYGVKRGSLS
ncbi:hypothetical protein Ddye_006220 [Dipteronia dyeriana]|uniref:F-box domain-containing protein n=1 Tax=Dipteronia dyeriana TaxID=168575 RepID=A0AAD9XI62_9ROSI|nr:hypothetical protein Ddye_006220 [Dipteronia dyeriana]